MNIQRKQLAAAIISSTFFMASGAALAGNEVYKTEGEHAKKPMVEERDSLAENTEEAWDDTKHETKDAWQDAKEGTKEAWKDTKQGSKELWSDSKKMFNEGVIAGRLESAIILNEHLNPFEIDIDVKGDRVTLSGEVDSEVDRELAENIAKGIEGVNDVSNNITVSEKARENTREMAKDVRKEDGKREFSQYVDDVSTTASIKAELLTNSEVEGLDINVDTYNDTVTLSGEVKSEQVKSLAEAIAKKRDGVKKVVNNLEVNS